MIIRSVFCGILWFIFHPAAGQSDLYGSDEVESMLQALDTVASNYRALQLTEELLQLVDTNQLSPALYEIYQKKGLAHLRAGNFRQAMIQQQRAAQIAYGLQDSFLMGQSAYRFGSIQYNQKLYESARQQYELAAAIFSRLDSLRWVAYIHNAFGLLERAQGNWQAALSYYRQSFDLLQGIGLSHLASASLNNIGDVYFNQKKFEQALTTFSQALELAQQQNNTNGMAIGHLNIGQCRRELKQYDRALQQTRQGIALARDNGLPRTAALGIRHLSKTFEKMKLADSALAYLQSYLHLEDSLRQQENNDQIEQLFVAYETEKARNEANDRQRQIEDLKKEKRLSILTNYLIILLLLFFLGVSSFFFVRNRMKRNLAESELRNEKLESEQMRRELGGKQKDLTNLALEIARKNELFTKTNEALREIQHIHLPPDKQQQIRKLIQYNNQQLRISEDLEELQVNIEQVNADFFEKLSQIAPDLTPAEKHLCALLRLNLGTKEIAAIRNISPKSVEMARYRLRKKLPIGPEEDVYGFVQGI